MRIHSKATIALFKKFNQINGCTHRHVKHIFTSIKTENVKEQYINIDGLNINYLKTGTGDHPVLLLPGALGSIWSDFKPQIKNLDKELFTIIAWDPPGYGKSRPPNRTFPSDYFQRDAYWAYNLMNTLGYNKFSLIGWSGGGVSSLILAAEYPESVKKLIIFGAMATVDVKDLQMFEALWDISSWTEQMRAPLIAMYGEEYVRNTLSQLADRTKSFVENNDGVVVSKDELEKIRCPTLIVHGEKDPIVRLKHPKFLKEQIRGARLELFKDGHHNLHLKYANKFNTLVHNFLIE